MSLFQTYFELGFRHIFTPRAYDHIVFLLALWQQQRSPPNRMQKQEQEPGDSTGGTN